MIKVFISHATHDRHFVEAEIVPSLTAVGHSYWYSKESIRSAELWERSILRGLQESDWFVVILSVRASRSEFVKDEINWAIENRSGKIIPIVIEDCKLTEFHIRLPRIQYVDWRKESIAARRHLLELLNEHASDQSTSCATEERPDYLTAKQDWIDSRSESGSLSIPASTRLIESGTLPAKKLALAHNARGCSFVREGRFDEALEDFSAAMALEPSNPIYYVNRGGLYLEKKGDARSAMHDLAFAAVMNPDDLTCCKLLGKLHLQERRYAQAATFLDRAVADVQWVIGGADGTSASAEGYFDLEAYYFRAQAHEKLGNKKQAIENYQLVASWPADGEEAVEMQIQAKVRLLSLTEKKK